MKPAALSARSKMLFPGVVVAGMTAITAQWLAEHYATPAMLLALLLGIALSFLGEEGKTVEGIGFAARTLLRLGIAFLGARISMELTAQLGLPLVMLIIG
ncbi:MAG: putative sulfate exporter family transporter, partial [Pseudomonadota bacterium]